MQVKSAKIQEIRAIYRIIRPKSPSLLRLMFHKPEPVLGDLITFSPGFIQLFPQKTRKNLSNLRKPCGTFSFGRSLLRLTQNFNEKQRKPLDWGQDRSKLIAWFRNSPIKSPDQTDTEKQHQSFSALKTRLLNIRPTDIGNTPLANMYQTLTETSLAGKIPTIKRRKRW